jgi:hypothetical protein
LKECFRASKKNMQDFSKMAESPDLRMLLLAYLLDEMPDDERERVDHQMLVDDDYSAALKEAEFDLLDAYEAGELTGEQRDRVYLALIAPRERRIEASIRNAELPGAPRGDVLTPLDEYPAPVTEIRRKTARLWSIAGVAAGVVLAVGLTAALNRWTQRRPEAQTAVQSGAKQSPPADKATGSEGQTPELHASVAASQPTAGPMKRSAPGAQMLTLVLSNTVRGSSGITAKLLPETELLRVEWPGASELQAEEAHPLRLAIANEEKVVATAPLARLEVKRGAKGGTAVFLLPVKGLAPGSYLFRVMGPGESSGTPQVYAENSITIER